MSKNSNYKVGLIGAGMVGSQVLKWFERDGEKIAVYDKNKGIGSLEEVYKQDVIFVCVPTPYLEGKGYDTSILDGVISEIPSGKIVVLKSTVNPGTTDMLQDKYQDKVIIFSPEFLTELTAEKDFFYPDMQILGVPHQGYKVACSIMRMLPTAPVMRIVSPIDAEWVKKTRNAYYTMKVVFFNQLYDMLKGPADYETVRSIVTLDTRIGNSHSFPFDKGKRGAGGKCLPKDIKSLLVWARDKWIETPLLSKVDEINDKYLSESLKGLPEDDEQRQVMARENVIFNG